MANPTKPSSFQLPKPSCYTENTMWIDAMSATFVQVMTAEECQQICSDSEFPTPCSDFTWFGPHATPYNNTCALYPLPSRPINISNTVSGPRSCTCSSSHTCTMHADMIVDIIEPVEVETECQDWCFRKEECSFYTWFDADGVPFQNQCVLLKSCEKDGSTAEGSHSGPESCENVGILHPFSPILPTSSSISVSSPNYPGPYTNDQNNTWIITTGRGV